MTKRQAVKVFNSERTYRESTQGEASRIVMKIIIRGLRQVARAAATASEIGPLMLKQLKMKE